MTLPTCNTCRFWSISAPGGDMGVCRRNAPIAIPVVTGSQLSTVWPGTKVSDACGQHEEPKDITTFSRGETLPPKEAPVRGS